MNFLPTHNQSLTDHWIDRDGSGMTDSTDSVAAVKCVKRDGWVYIYIQYAEFMRANVRKPNFEKIGKAFSGKV